MGSSLEAEQAERYEAGHDLKADHHGHHRVLTCDVIPIPGQELRKTTWRASLWRVPGLAQGEAMGVKEEAPKLSWAA